ncbi:tripartite tricarboxylate transporter substrate binding protein [Marinovum sp. 2_MG-2023]|uniref:Bug family tripartite tricarboxylate transporter substrate binding protein n=1 Tax=unclassified Marinovum TaxID=2647166 RepID=UPI0026E26F09|nr:MULTISPECIES: tripartite tricarboxylate transporter substrate binding protein [unclassified Marinovum]MDO6730536.1 tripartite tricarboxylate transporter substrate binding protein [Marinovum sp. 2_MG-2023]MDO6778686.1 tripartite tricarboxylate transporter substrate binding protein [Marinovum sp. 1_MG-2023]
MQRRTLLATTVAALATLSMPVLADTNWPERPVRILVSFPPGGSSDLVARLLGEKLSASLGQQFVVENKPGAAGTVAASALKEAEPDGYTLMLSNLTPFNVAPIRFPDTPYDAIADFDHITYVGTVHLGLFAAPSMGVSDLAGLIDAAKADPGAYEYGSSGVGSWGHIIAEQFQNVSDTELFHIPYKGSGPMRLDFRGGVVPSIFDAVPQNLPAVEEGTAIPLAVTATERLSSLPDVPTFTELGYDIVAENWLGFSAPAGVPEDIKTKLDSALTDAMALPEVKAQFDTWGLVRAPKTSEAFSEYVSAQLDQWTPMVKAAME